LRVRRVWCFVLAAGLAAAAMSALFTGTGLATPGSGPTPASASAHIYWSHSQVDTWEPGEAGFNAIGRANRDGTEVQKNFIKNPHSAGDLAVGAGHIYWIDVNAGELARANLDGSHVKRNVLFCGWEAGDAVAIGAGHVYWVSGIDGPGPARIERANLDGSHINRDFISIGRDADAGGIALNRRFIYWTDPSNDTIGRADLSARHVIRRFITSARDPFGIALDGQHLYWAEIPRHAAEPATIARADLSGMHVNHSFISGASTPFGVAVDSQYVYWANFGSGTIGRAALGGGEVSQAFITAGITVEGQPPGTAPMGLAVGP
jgi:hypothetical protein